MDEKTLEAGDHFTFDTNVGPLNCLGAPAGTRGYPDLSAAATDEDLDRVIVRVASLDDLIRMKEASGRPQDKIDVEWLAAVRDQLEGNG